MLAISTVVIAVVGLSAYTLLKILGDDANPNLTDNEIAQDLSIVEKAIWNDYGHTGLLPESLGTVSVSGLQGEKEDYDYHLVQQYEGGPNESFALCSAFHSDTAKADDPKFAYSYYYATSIGYTYHKKGTQCFVIGWDTNGGESVVKLMRDTPDWAR